jgi:hypothetical protein
MSNNFQATGAHVCSQFENLVHMYAHISKYLLIEIALAGGWLAGWRGYSK